MYREARLPGGLTPGPAPGWRKCREGGLAAWSQCAAGMAVPHGLLPAVVPPPGGRCRRRRTSGPGSVRRRIPAVRGLRRRRNELEYPHLPADTATPEEAEQAAQTAQMLITAAGKLLPQLSFFSQDLELRDHRRNRV